MSRCNAWHGEPNSCGSVHYRCQRPKGHKGEHYCRKHPLRVYWEQDDRGYLIIWKREKQLVRREMKDIPVTTDEEIHRYLEIEKLLHKKYEEKYKTWRGWLTGGRS